VRRLVGPILFLFLVAEIAAASAIVMAQPGGFSALFDVGGFNFGPERRQDVAAQTLPLNGQAANITINSMGGQVEISGDPSLTAVRVEGTKIIHSFKDSDFDRISFNVVQDGNNIRIEAKQANRSFNFGFGEQMQIRVALPPALLTQLNTTVGSANITVKGLQNDKAVFILNTGSGNITASDLQTAHLTAKTGSGDIHLTGFLGSVDATTGSGDIDLNGQNRLNDLNLETGSGDVQLAALLNITNNSTIKTGSGDVELNLGASKAPGFDINTGSGSINFKLPNTQIVNQDKHALKTGGSPVINIKTGSGDVTVE
jgi:hypothetical protein